MHGESSRGSLGLRAPSLGLVVASLVAAGLVPHAHRLLHPSIFGDDLTRVFVVQTQPLPRAVTSAFNEHVAPVFDAVTWLSWAASGGRLTAIPLAFTIVAFVPFLLALAALGIYARRVLGGWPVALLVVAAFAVAPVHVVETVWWYSGSNHMWAVFWTLVALLGVDRGGRSGWLAAAVGSAFAPACSMMGVLAVPACITQALMRRGRSAGRGMSPAAALAATVAGLGIYLGFAVWAGLIRAVLTGRVHAAQPIEGLKVAGEAPMLVLVPALFGLRDLDAWIPPAWALAISGGFGLAVLVWASRSRHRATILVGLGLIAGGYAIIYPFRTAGGPELMLRTARYHVYPQLGLALLVGVAARRFLDGPRGAWAATVACTLLMATHLPRMIGESGYYDFPSQASTLAGLQKVREICKAEGISAREAVAALEPIRPHWMPIERADANAAWLIGTFEFPPRVPDPEVRGRLLAGLDPVDREGLFGGMDAGPYLTPADAVQGLDASVITALPAASLRVRPHGGAAEYEVEGWPSFLEYAIDAPERSVASSRWLVLPVIAPPGGVEVWWDDGQSRWTEGRSVHWSIDANRPRGVVWGVPLERLPHWDGQGVRRLRVIFRYPGEVAVRPPRLVRPEGQGSRGRVSGLAPGGPAMGGSRPVGGANRGDRS